MRYGPFGVWYGQQSARVSAACAANTHTRSYHDEAGKRQTQGRGAMSFPAQLAR